MDPLCPYPHFGSTATKVVRVFGMLADNQHEEHFSAVAMTSQQTWLRHRALLPEIHPESIDLLKKQQIPLGLNPPTDIDVKPRHSIHLYRVEGGGRFKPVPLKSRLSPVI